VLDLQEAPAVPPFDPQGDERAGLFGAGGLLIFLGWGLGVVVNLVVHHWAPAGGERILGVYFGPALGVYAEATLAFGLVTGAIGVVLVGLARASPKGPVVLPGYEYGVEETRTV
jgi:hypothetical protein